MFDIGAETWQNSRRPEYLKIEIILYSQDRTQIKFRIFYLVNSNQIGMILQFYTLNLDERPEYGGA